MIFEIVLTLWSSLSSCVAAAAVIFGWLISSCSLCLMLIAVRWAAAEGGGLVCEPAGTWLEDTETHSKASWGGSQGNQDTAQWQGSTGEEASAHESHVWRLQKEDARGAVQRAEAYGNSCKICQDRGVEGKHPQEEWPVYPEVLGSLQEKPRFSRIPFRVPQDT